MQTQPRTKSSQPGPPTCKVRYHAAVSPVLFRALWTPYRGNPTQRYLCNALPLRTRAPLGSCRSLFRQ